MAPWDFAKRYADKQERAVVGLMSGTSLDGVDAVVVRVSGNGRATRISEQAFVTLPFPVRLRERVMALCHGHGNAEEVSRVNFLLGGLFADAVNAVLSKASLQARDINLIASHGQTVSHCPPAATLQIGEPAVLALRFGVPVVSDFRAADVAAGGQGAPLVPYADWCLLAHPGKCRVVQNIGGIGNLTYLPANAALEDMLGFDTGPGNMLIDRAAQWASDGTLLCDEDGALANGADVDRVLLERLMAAPFLALRPPKSAGREEFGEAFFETLKTWLPADSTPQVQRSLVATLTAFTAETIADSYRRFLPAMPDEIIIGGGGSRNPTLLRMLAERLPAIPIYTHENLGMNGDSKEAVAFALLANETALGNASNVPSVTGASQRVILGSGHYRRPEHDHLRDSGVDRYHNREILARCPFLILPASRRQRTPPVLRARPGFHQR